jgi:hypothetical protein
MNQIRIVSLSLVIAVAASAAQAQQPPEMPGPEEEHAWLQQLVGEWDTEGEVTMGPDQPPMKCKGTATTRSLGGFWVISESGMTMMEFPMKGVMTLGYDPKSEKYIGTWIDSVSSYMWKYEGTLDEDQKKLTLLTEGPNPMAPTETANYREVFEIKDKDHKVFTSSIEMDGQWHTFVTIHYHRKK